MSKRFFRRESPRNRRVAWRNVVTNMNVPMPLPRKLWLLTRNVSLRLLTASDCCGNHGEPGC